jgi:inner membrane protein
LNDPLVRQAIRSPELGSFMRWSILPQAVVQRSRCSAKVVVGDARYGPPGESRLYRDVEVPTGAPGC